MIAQLALLELKSGGLLFDEACEDFVDMLISFRCFLDGWLITPSNVTLETIARTLAIRSPKTLIAPINEKAQPAVKVRTEVRDAVQPFINL